MRSPFITRSRHARELAAARHQARVAAIADTQRDISRIWDTLRDMFGDEKVRTIQRAFYAQQFSSVPMTYMTGMAAPEPNERSAR